MPTRYKVKCCGATSWNPPKRCIYCKIDNPIVEECYPDEATIYVGKNFSGDKSYEKRPWGSFKVVLDEQNVKIKKITVEPNHTLSLQLHKHRDEWWKVIQGVGEVQIGSKIIEIRERDSVEIQKLSVHRVSNTGTTNLVFVEVQTGVCKEDDIVRIEDEYGRD